MVEYRCRKCHRLLFRAEAERGKVQVICPDRRCRTAQLIFLTSEPELGVSAPLFRRLLLKPLIEN